MEQILNEKGQKEAQNTLLKEKIDNMEKDQINMQDELKNAQVKF